MAKFQLEGKCIASFKCGVMQGLYGCEIKMNNNHKLESPLEAIKVV